MIKTIAFDADETLWGNNRHYRETRFKFAQLLTPNDAPATVEALHQLERKNVELYGFGVRSIMLNMIELASTYQATSEQILQILQIGKNLLQHSYSLFDGVEQTLRTLKQSRYQIICVTKGDLKDQKNKMQSSSIAGYFDHVEVVVHKNIEEWQHLIKILRLKASAMVMVGDSLSNDILPALEVGMNGVWIPQELKPHFEQSEDNNIPYDNPRFKELQNITQLPKYLQTIL